MPAGDQVGFELQKVAADLCDRLRPDAHAPGSPAWIAQQEDLAAALQEGKLGLVVERKTLQLAPERNRAGHADDGDIEIGIALGQNFGRNLAVRLAVEPHGNRHRSHAGTNHMIGGGDIRAPRVEAANDPGAYAGPGLDHDYEPVGEFVRLTQQLPGTTYQHHYGGRAMEAFAHNSIRIQRKNAATNPNK